MKKKPKLVRLNLKISNHLLDCLFSQGLNLEEIRKVDKAIKQFRKELKSNKE